MRIALRGADRHVGHHGDLFEGEPERILEHDHARLLGRDLREAPVQLATQLGPIRLVHGICLRRCAPVLEQRLARACTLPVRDVATGVDRQPVQPRRELRLPPELPDPSAELREGLLRRVARILRVAQHVQRELLDARRVPFAQRFESARVAVFCPFDQDRIAQPCVNQWPFRTEGLLNWTAAASRQLHLAVLV